VGGGWQGLEGGAGGRAARTSGSAGG
jgi:hypothetical protein